MLKDRLFKPIIICISILGIAYFGYRAVREDLTRQQENPFEYNIDHFKETDENLYHYSEETAIFIPLERVFGLTLTADNRIAVSGDDSILQRGQEIGRWYRPPA